MGGCDKQRFLMKHGVLTPGRVRLLLHREHLAFEDMVGVMEKGRRSVE
ncbi:hypothetical protein SLEP1_g42139 [Rubroshorea leprosula]|uniref:Uncharacterized protein n=1 Tax=Rubroshorea leprosula TaxID=152421 RepID=A0AAV5L944_9ROSI|nr:hypothetical protein SLEP1_g42139 [Rubroshorea leprosula]